MKMCSNTYLMHLLSDFELLTPAVPDYDTLNVQTPLDFIDFGPKLTFFAAAFKCWKAGSSLEIPYRKCNRGGDRVPASQYRQFHHHAMVLTEY